MAYLQFLVSYSDVKLDRVRERSPGAGFYRAQHGVPAPHSWSLI
jgi:hypothetical protein